jgi:hypothetical protein
MSSLRRPAPQGIDMVERAIFLLRSCPSGVWAVQAAGAIPLLLVVLYFGFEMTSAGGDSNPVTEALACAVCFLWFSVCRARFAQLLVSALSDQNRSGWRQALDPGVLAIQSCKLFAMPLAFIAAFPLGWSVSFFRTVDVLGGRSVPERSAKMAGLWPRQTWAALCMLALISVVVFLNLLLVLAFLPSLVQIVSGTENSFTRLGFGVNGAVLAMAAGLSWLVLDPLYQAVFCVRAFLADSRETGLDLLFALRRLVPVILLAITMVPHAGAQPAPRITPGQLDASVERVLEQREYAWRFPRGHEAKPGFLDGVLAPVRAAFHKVVRWIGELIDRWFRNNPSADTGRKPVPFPAVQWTLYLLVSSLIALLGFLLARFATSRDRAPAHAPVQAPRTIALDNEEISAADLPEDKWMELGRECLARDDYRLALRAFYLASLSWLGRRELLTIASFKSNRDYRRELRRRTPSDALQQAFAENVELFERGWYGTHPVDAEQVGGFMETFSRMKTYVEA